MVIQALPQKEIPRKLKDWEKRVLFFNPADVYARLQVNHYKRYQSLSIKLMFPKNGRMCGCGCGKTLTGRQTRWATPECYAFANSVWGIITGQMPVIRRFIKKYFGRKCFHCTGRSVGKLEVDHIVAVMRGGGCAWLSNYQLLCNTHHKAKTNIDRPSKVTILALPQKL